VLLQRLQTDADKLRVSVMPRGGPSKRALPGPRGVLHHQAPLVRALLPEQASAGTGLRENSVLLPFGSGETNPRR
ncbi:hypothetical protein HPB47_028105, partial [Ixodes persulcatus]